MLERLTRDTHLGGKSVIRTLASTENPLFSQASMSAAAAPGTGSVCVSKRCLSLLCAQKRSGTFS